MFDQWLFSSAPLELDCSATVRVATYRCGCNAGDAVQRCTACCSMAVLQRAVLHRAANCCTGVVPDPGAVPRQLHYEQHSLAALAGRAASYPYRSTPMIRTPLFRLFVPRILISRTPHSGYSYPLFRFFVSLIPVVRSPYSDFSWPYCGYALPLFPLFVPRCSLKFVAVITAMINRSRQRLAIRVAQASARGHHWRLAAHAIAVDVPAV